MATLTNNTTDEVIQLGCEFIYDPYVPQKRFNVVQTAKASFTEIEDPIFNTGNEYIDFSYDLLQGELVKQLQAAYDSDALFNFEGLYGDEYLIQFTEFIPKAFPVQLFEISGKFRVLCIISPFDPCFGCE